MTKLTLGKYAFRSFAVATLSLLAACGDPEPIKVGIVVGLSGRSADLGEASRNAVQLAADEINQAGGIDGRPISLIPLDDEGRPETAAEAARKAHEEGVVAIIGTNLSSTTAGLLPEINQLKLVTISPTASSLEFVDLDDYLFRINWSTRDNARIYAKHYYDLGIRRVSAAVDANNRVFSESWLNEFRSAFEALGEVSVQPVLFDANSDQGYSSTARKLTENSPDAFLLIANSVDTAQLTQQIRKLDTDTLIVAAEWAASERLLQLGGKAIEGIEMVQSYDRNNQSERYLKFKNAYEERFQRPPGFASVASYDAATMLFAALAKDEDPEELKNNLVRLPVLDGLQQPLKFNKYGDAERRAFFVTVKDGSFVQQ
ncbi:ABC transporter substrate-binding protein [Hwanghaeella sp.]|uniref:ABC transporter substrate-binding protein n=1 Tax=Hwanghaeella sp. TaxID=2605943 RepID=UPI003CCBBD51